MLLAVVGLWILSRLGLSMGPVHIRHVAIAVDKSGISASWTAPKPVLPSLTVKTVTGPDGQGSIVFPDHKILGFRFDTALGTSSMSAGVTRYGHPGDPNYPGPPKPPDPWVGTTFHYHLTIPIWFPALVLVLLPALWLYERIRRRNIPEHACPHCRYDLRGTLAAGRSACPECGAAIGATPRT